MESALIWTSTNVNHPSITILFCTDSKSLCEALISSSLRTFSIHNSINSISSSIFIHWIPGHSAIPGNELANKVAKEATTIATKSSVSFSSSIQVFNEAIRDDPPTHERVARVYQHQKAFQDSKQIKNRKDDLLLARLRSGHHPCLDHYLRRLDPTQDPICPSCRVDEQDLNHWLYLCPASDTIKQRVFGNYKAPLECLTTQPGNLLAYASKTLVSLDA